MKYMGSKSRITKYIVPIIQEYIDKNNITKYYEPFVGGANVIDKINCPNRYASDLNKYLIALLRHVRDGKDLYKEVSKELYDRARTAYNNNDTSEFQDWEIGNIGFIASFNGRWFDGGYAKTGYEKTNKGLRLRNYYREAKDNLISQAPHLVGIKFNTSDYREAPKYFSSYENFVIYCDPPYSNTKQYTNALTFDYDEFWQTVRDWSKNNIVLVSEQDAPSDFECIWEQEVSRSIKANDKRKATEKLFKFKED